MLLKPLRHGSVRLYTTNLTQEQLRQTDVAHVASLEEAITASVREQKSSDIEVIPEGPYVIPLYRGTSGQRREQGE